MIESDAQQSIDDGCLQIIDTDVSLTVPWYIMVMYGRSEMDSEVISNSVLDKLVKRMLQYWNEIEHRYKEYLSEEDVRLGNPIKEYPGRTEQSVKVLLEIYHGRRHRN
jgi:hypothetical protein